MDRKEPLKIFVLSNKGGVGKTTISILLSKILSEKYKVALLDLDIHGPNIPKALNIESQIKVDDNNKLIPHQVSNNLQMISVDFLMSDNKNNPILWRGPLKNKLIVQFLTDVKWSNPDIMVFDLPPGTGDETITLMQMFNKNAKAIVVSIPTKESIYDCEKAIKACKEFNVDILGVIENMSNDVFGFNTLEDVAKKHSIEFLGSIELSKEILNLNIDFSKKYLQKTIDIIEKLL